MNTARKVSPESTATSIEISQFVQPKKSDKTSRYTSKNIKKATAAEPIRDPEVLKQIEEYILSNAKTEWYGRRNLMAFILGTSTGLRASDVLNLRIGDVINEDGSFKHHIIIREQKTNKRNDPKLSARAAEAIRDYLFVTKKKLTFDDYLIQSERGGKLDKSQLYRIVHAPQEALGLEEHLSTHTMRKTFGYHTIRSNPNDVLTLADVQEMFNHSSSRTTLRYCGLDRERQDRYYDAISDLL